MDDASVIATVKGELTWLQKHERLLLAAMLGIVLTFGVYSVEKHMDASASTQVQVLQAQLNSQKDQNVQNAAHSAQIEAQYATMVDMFQKQNAALASAVVSRNTGLTQQQSADKNLPPTELALRWQGLIGGSNDVATTGSGFNISASGALATVTLLEEVPVLRADLVDETKIVDNKNAELGKAGDVIVALNTQVSGLKTQITDEEKVSDAKITALERKSRLSKLRWFLAGVVTGFLGRGQI